MSRKEAAETTVIVIEDLTGVARRWERKFRWSVRTPEGKVASYLNETQTGSSERILLEGRARTAEKAQSKAGKERDRFIRGEAWDDDREYFLSTQKKVVISQEEAVVKAIRENPGQPVVRIQPPRHENTGLSH